MKRLIGKYFSKLLRMARGLNSEDHGSQPESQVEVADRTLTPEDNSSSSDYFTCVSSPSRLPCSNEEFHTSRQYAPLPESHVEEPAYSQRAGEHSSSSEYFTCVSSPSKLSHENDGSCTSRQYVPQPELRVEDPTYSQRAGEQSSSSTYFTCVSSPSRLPRGNEAFHPLQQNVSPLGTQKKPVSQGNTKRSYTSRQHVPQPELRVEDPTYSQRAGEQSSSSTYFTCVSSPSRLPRGNEAFHSLQQNVSPLGTRKKPVSQGNSKRKRMEGNPGVYPPEFYTSRQNAPQPELLVEFPANGQRAGEQSSSFAYYTCVSPPSRLPHGNEAFHPLQQNVSRLGTQKKPVSQGNTKRRRMEGNPGAFHPLQQNVSPLGTLKKPISVWSSKRRRMEGHQGEFYTSQQHAPQPESRVENPANSQRAGEHASSSEYFTCVSSPSRLSRGNDVSCPLHRNVLPLGTLKEPVSQPTRKRKRVEGYSGEMNQRPLPQDLGQSKMFSSSSSSQTSSLVFSNNDDNPCMSSALGADERVMTIFYMHVQMQGGVAVLYNTEEGFKPPSKKIKIQKMTYIEKVHKNIPCSHTSVKKFPTDHEPSSSQEKWSSTYSGAQPPARKEYSRVSRPEWLLAAKSGFRCMACCRVFPSLEDLREHVEHGVNEGFSCHTFHLNLARLKRKEPKEGNKETERATFRYQIATHFGLKKMWRK